MAVSLKHIFHSAKTDGTDPTLVQPSNWNAEHTVTCAADVVLGHDSSAPGAVQELPCTAQGRAILAAASLADLIAAGFPLFSTGDFKLTIKTVADVGWLMCNDGTIGNTSSGATYHNANAQALYTLVYNNVSDTYAPVTGGRGANATADWTAQKPIALTKMLGRALAIAGAGSALTSRSLGQTFGEENHTLVLGELASHDHGTLTSTEGASHGHAVPTPSGKNGTTPAGPVTGTSGNIWYGDGGTVTSGAEDTVHSHTIVAAGSDTPHNNMQPTSFVNIMIKL